MRLAGAQRFLLMPPEILIRSGFDHIASATELQQTNQSRTDHFLWRLDLHTSYPRYFSFSAGEFDNDEYLPFGFDYKE